MENSVRLKNFRRIKVYRPDCPDVRRWICMGERRIYINVAAPNGKIEHLVFREEKIIFLKPRK